MTPATPCSHFDRRQLAWLAGDLAEPPAPHDPRCPRCQRRERAARRLAEALALLREMPPGLDAARQAVALAHEPLYYDTMDSPVGPLLLVASDQGLRAIHYLAQRASPLAERARYDPARLAAARRQLEQYFARQRTAFDLAVDLRGVGAFGERVLHATARIPFGQVSSYGALARAVGAPGAARAVGMALGRNPIPIVIPCHRVLRGDGSLGGYSGGLWVKDRLLTLEGVRSPS